MRLPAIGDKVRSHVQLRLTDGRRVQASSSYWPWMLRLVFRLVKSGWIPILVMCNDYTEDVEVMGPMIAEVLVARFDGGESR